MSDYTVTASEAQATVMVRKDPAGTVIEVETDRTEYTVPPQGQYALSITGFAKPFEMARGAEYGGGTQMMTRLEYEILDGKGKGKRFTQMVGLSVGGRSKMGGVIAGARGRPIAQGENVDLLDIIGLRFNAFVSHDKTKEGVLKVDETGKAKYASVVVDTIQPLEPATVGANGTDPDDGWPE